VRGLAEKEGLLNECGEVAVLTVKEWDVDFKGRPYNGNLVYGTSLRGRRSPGCGSAGDGLPICSAVQESSEGGTHVCIGKWKKEVLGRSSWGL